MVYRGNPVGGQGRCWRHRAAGVPFRPGPWGCVLLLLALIPLLPAAAAADAVDIHAVIGFGDVFRPGHWTPLTVTVGHRGGGDLDGELEVQVTTDDASRGRQRSTFHRQHLELHGAARKRLHFTVLPQGLFHPLVIRVRSGGREVARAAVDLRTRFAPQRLLLVLSRNADLDYLNDAAVDGLRVLYPHPELLPAHWRGYDAVSAIVLHDVSLEQLSSAQFEALHKWIAQGGVLAVSGGPDYSLLKTARLSALLPAVPAGIVPLDAGVLKRAFAGTLAVSRPVHVHRIAATRGEVRLRAGEVPLIVERALGLGRVLYLTFDVTSPPFDRWPGMRRLWLETLEMASTPVALSAGSERMTGSALAALIRNEAEPFPRYSTAFLFLALYLGLLFAGYAIPLGGGFRRWLAPFWGWGAPLVFAPIAWVLFGPGAFPREASMATVALIEPLPQSGYAHLDLELGAYTYRSGRLRLEYRGVEPVFYPLRTMQQDSVAADWVLGAGSRRFVEPLDRRRYVLHALEGEDVIAFPLDASLQRSPEGPRLDLVNASGRDLEDAWLVFEGHAYALGAVAAGSRLEHRLLVPEDSAARDDAWRRALRPPAGGFSYLSGPEQVLLERKAKAMGERGFPGTGHALLIAYTESPLRPTGASADWPRQERALVAFRFKVPAGTGAGSPDEPGRLEPGSGTGEARPLQGREPGGAPASDRTNDAKQSARH
jgi:hypothetical protein